MKKQELLSYLDNLGISCKHRGYFYIIDFLAIYKPGMTMTRAYELVAEMNGITPINALGGIRYAIESVGIYRNKDFLLELYNKFVKEI